jgi:hypothetical protein
MDPETPPGTPPDSPPVSPRGSPPTIISRTTTSSTENLLKVVNNENIAVKETIASYSPSVREDIQVRIFESLINNRNALIVFIDKLETQEVEPERLASGKILTQEGVLTDAKNALNSITNFFRSLPRGGKRHTKGRHTKRRHTKRRHTKRRRTKGRHTKRRRTKRRHTNRRR